jgi:hypothetical protein
MEFHRRSIRLKGFDYSAPGAPLSQTIQWFKTMTANQYIRGVKELNWRSFTGELRRRNYYERVIRNEKEWDRIQRHIESNPSRWRRIKKIFRKGTAENQKSLDA